MTRPYHKYVFDTEKREFVGQFEEMYRAEAANGYDSWHQENLTTLGKQLSLTILQRYNFASILDIGCGKGTFTHLLKKANNEVVGVDLSDTAVAKARAKYEGIEFLQMDTTELKSLNRKFDVVVAMEIFSYLEHWRELLGTLATMTQHLYLSLYLPANPIGFVKSFDDLIAELSKYFVVEVEVLVNRDQILILASKK